MHTDSQRLRHDGVQLLTQEGRHLVLGDPRPICEAGKRHVESRAARKAGAEAHAAVWSHLRCRFARKAACRLPDSWRAGRTASRPGARGAQPARCRQSTRPSRRRLATALAQRPGATRKPSGARLRCCRPATAHLANRLPGAVRRLRELPGPVCRLAHHQEHKLVGLPVRRAEHAGCGQRRERPWLLKDCRRRPHTCRRATHASRTAHRRFPASPLAGASAGFHDCLLSSSSTALGSTSS